MSEIQLNEFIEQEPETSEAEELDVQKAVVESLAAEKVERDEQISTLRKENYALKSEISSLKDKIEEMRKVLQTMGDVLSKNSDTPISSKISLLERDAEIDDRFPGETRDHVLEVIQEAREAAERDGRHRRAQILESVLVANERVGELEKRRKGLEKLFADNANIVSGPVIAELEKIGISHKNGEEYLLPSEIIKRTF